MLWALLIACAGFGLAIWLLRLLSVEEDHQDARWNHSDTWDKVFADMATADEAHSGKSFLCAIRNTNPEGYGPHHEWVYSILGRVADHEGLLEWKMATRKNSEVVGVDYHNNLSPHTVLLPPGTAGLTTRQMAHIVVLGGKFKTHAECIDGVKAILASSDEELARCLTCL